MCVYIYIYRLSTPTPKAADAGDWWHSSLQVVSLGDPIARHYICVYIYIYKYTNSIYIYIERCVYIYIYITHTMYVS